MSKAMPIQDFPGYYVSDTGNVYSRKTYNNPTGRIKKLKPTKMNKGYFYVNLRKNNTTYHKTIHRLVANAFLANKKNAPQVNHKNGIKTDNNVTNLEWCTASENQLHRRRTLGNSKKVLQLKNGIVLKQWANGTEAAQFIGINYRNLYSVLKNRRKSAGGFEWRYAGD